PEGLWEITFPTGTVSEFAVALLIWKSFNATRALSSVRPVTSGTGTVAGPALTRRVTVEPTSALSPAAGRVPSTVPLDASFVGRLICTMKPSLRRVFTACWALSPSTDGTARWSGPESRMAKYQTAAPASARSTMTPIRIGTQGLRLGGSGGGGRRGWTRVV